MLERREETTWMIQEATRQPLLVFLLSRQLLWAAKTEEICKVLLCRLAPSVSLLIPFLKFVFNKHYETDTRGCLQKQIHLSSNVDSYFGHLQKSPMLFFPPNPEGTRKNEGHGAPLFPTAGWGKEFMIPPTERHSTRISWRSKIYQAPHGMMEITSTKLELLWETCSSSTSGTSPHSTLYPSVQQNSATQ